jgi:hypothetical protein
MYVIVKRTAGVLVWLVVIHGLVSALSTVVYPSSRYVDSDVADRTLFKTIPVEILMNRDLLRNSSKKVIVLGTSNARRGLRPDELRRYLPEYEVHNLSASGGNMTQVLQTLEIGLGEIPPEAIPQTVFVLGTWYGCFTLDRYVYTDQVRTPLEEQKSYYGLYPRDSEGFPPRIPSVLLPAWRYFLRPYLFVSRAVDERWGGRYPADFVAGASEAWQQRGTLAEMGRNGFARVRATMRARTPESKEDVDRMQLDAAGRAQSLASAARYMGGPDRAAFNEEQLEILRRLDRVVTRADGRLVLLDLPLPKWHKERSPHFPLYQAQKMQYFSRLTAGHLYYVSLQHLDDDDDFFDATHPKPRVTDKWARSLAHRLKDLFGSAQAN